MCSRVFYVGECALRLRVPKAETMTLCSDANVHLSYWHWQWFMLTRQQTHITVFLFGIPLIFIPPEFIPVVHPFIISCSLTSVFDFRLQSFLVSSKGHIHGCGALSNSTRLWCRSNQLNGSKGLTYKDDKCWFISPYLVSSF